MNFALLTKNKNEIIILDDIFFQSDFIQIMNMIIDHHFTCLHFRSSLLYMLVKIKDYLNASLETFII